MWWAQLCKWMLVWRSPESGPMRPFLPSHVQVSMSRAKQLMAPLDPVNI